MIPESLKMNSACLETINFNAAFVTAKSKNLYLFIKDADKA